jgi:hypothetical protein
MVPINIPGDTAMFDDMLSFLIERYGESWAADDEANLRFSVEAEFLIRAIEGVHLVGEPAIEDDRLTISVWIDQPIPDLMTADQLAYAIFGRLSEQLFIVERTISTRSIVYRFVTGSPTRGDIGALEMVGPHAADFAERHEARYGAIRYQA